MDYAWFVKGDISNLSDDLYNMQNNDIEGFMDIRNLSCFQIDTNGYNLMLSGNIWK